MGKTHIEWTRGDDGSLGKTWNPVRGCSMVSEGCRSCYAMKQAHRFSGPGQPYEGLTEIGPNGPRWNGKVRLVPEVLDAPLRWKKPCRVFVNSMSDLFHEDVPDGFILDVFRIMFNAPRHTFQILTKRPERMLDWCRRFADTTEDDYKPKLARGPEAVRAAYKSGRAHLFADMIEGWGNIPGGAAYPTYDWMEGMIRWPAWLGNVWLGISVEDRGTWLERSVLLKQTPAAVRFISYEPALESLGEIDLSGIHWVVGGGESGPGARPFNIQWARDVIRQCKAAGVACFTKQLGSQPYEDVLRTDVTEHAVYGPEVTRYTEPKELNLKDRKGGDMAEWPEDLRVREFPR